jgi:hypothetical protein
MGYIRYLDGARAHSSYPMWDINARVRVPTTADRLEYIAAVVPGAPIPIADDEKLEIRWQDRQDYIAKRDRFRQDLVQRYSVMIRQLRDANLLSADEATALAAPSIEIVVDDRREDKAPL